MSEYYVDILSKKSHLFCTFCTHSNILGDNQRPSEKPSNCEQGGEGELY